MQPYQRALNGEPGDEADEQQHRKHRNRSRVRNILTSSVSANRSTNCSATRRLIAENVSDERSSDANQDDTHPVHWRATRVLDARSKKQPTRREVALEAELHGEEERE